MNNNQIKGVALIIGGILSAFILPFLLRLILGYDWDSLIYSYPIIPKIFYLFALVLSGFGVYSLISKVDKNDNADDTNKISESVKSEVQTNKVVKITVVGGLIGLLVGNPVESLNKRIKTENSQGWEVVQILPDTSINLLIWILRLILLAITFLFYTTSNGYYIVLKQKS